MTSKLKRIAVNIINGARPVWRALRFLYLDPPAMILMLRMAAWIVTFSLMMRVLPLPRVLRLITPRHRRSSARDQTELPAKLAWSVDTLLKTNFLSLTPTCWKRAAILYRYLAINGIETRIMFGVRRDEDGALAGHAWLEDNGRPLLEATKPDYRVTYSFPD